MTESTRRPTLNLWNPPARRVGVVLVDTGPGAEPLRLCRVRISGNGILAFCCPHVEGHAGLHGYPDNSWTDVDPRRIADATGGFPLRLCEYPCATCATAPPQPGWT